MKRKYLIIAGSILSIMLLSGCQTNIYSDLSSSDTTTATVELPKTIVKMDFPSYSSAEEMCQKADVVFIGTVSSSRQEIIDISLSGEPCVLPFTIYTFKITQTLKGDIQAESSYDVKILGGIMDGNEYVVSGEPITLQTGTSYFIAASAYETCYASPLNYSQAVTEYNAEETSFNFNNQKVIVNELMNTLQEK